MPAIKKVLVANRGEIAVRVMRTCREMDIKTVAVFSDADATALHVRSADEARRIGPAAAAESYLQQDRILAVAKETGADAIHPGYGFLSENPEFAAKVEAAGLTFIGPSSQAMRLMGDKTSARQQMQKAGVPIVPGTAEPLNSADEAKKVANDIGYPVLLKAAAGGGGKGMRVVASEDELARNLEMAASEAKSAFGDGRVYIEKYLEEPRHIEIQIMADKHGHVVHFGERECSIQRRHQKVIEEAPSSLLTEKMRAEMGKAAIEAARACDYSNAGTIEFLVDKHLNFYFLEMNTRLQVEHPVTEMVTRTDLVRMQLEVAAGNKLPVKQEDIRLEGHAIECRVYAEDPRNNFLPDIGKIDVLDKPDGPGIREDSGVVAGDTISRFYDPMIAKLCAWAPTRDLAIARMRRALSEYRISGVSTTVQFCSWVLDHEHFRSGNFDTHFVRRFYVDTGIQQQPELTDAQQQEAAAIAALLSSNSKPVKQDDKPAAQTHVMSNWRRRGWRS